MLQIIIGSALFLFLVSCNPNLRNARCGGCMGPLLIVRIDPPVTEDIEIEIKSDKENFKTTCQLAYQEFPDTTLRGNCEGESIRLEPSPSSVPTSPSPSSRSRFPDSIRSPFPTYKVVNFNKYTVHDFQANKIEIIVRTLQGKVLGQQTFQLNFELSPYCAEFKNCTTTEITLHLSKPTEPTPTPSNTPTL